MYVQVVYISVQKKYTQAHWKSKIQIAQKENTEYCTTECITCTTRVRLNWECYKSECSKERENIMVRNLAGKSTLGCEKAQE